MRHFQTSDPILTGRTRYAMRGIWPFRKARLQVEESYVSTDMETQTFSSVSNNMTRWRFANAADLMNMEEPRP